MTKKTYESKANYQLSERYSYQSLEKGTDDPKGNIFISRAGQIELTDFEILSSTIDTVRQLYYGLPDSGMVEKLDNCIDSQTPLRLSTVNDFHVSRMAKVSGFKYKVQSNEFGLVFLFGSYYSKIEQVHSHLKVEVSPKFLYGKSSDLVQRHLDQLASKFMQWFEHKGIAIHLATDFQGWKPDNTFFDNFITYSRFNRVFDGISEMKLEDDWSGVSSRFGTGSGSIQTLLFGKPTSLQTCLYNKTLEIKSSDKVDYFHELWGKESEGIFDPDKEVWRLEYRFHHQILREIGQGLGVTIESYHDAYKYIADIWAYGIKRNRLELKKGLLHPVWQSLLQDSHFPVNMTTRPIYRKKKQDVSAIGKNLSLILGNLITVCARQNMKTSEFMRQLKSLSFYDDLVNYYRSRNLTEADLREQIDKGLCLRRLIGKAA